MNSKNVDLNAIINNVNALQKNSKVKLKHLCNDKKRIISIIELLIKILILKKKKNEIFS